MRKLFVVTAIGVLLIAATLSPAVCAMTWSMEADFSTTSNPVGVWTYGYQKPLGGSLVLYNTASGDSSACAWYADNNPDKYGVIWKNLTAARDYNGVYLSSGGAVMHPGPSDEKATARWTAPYAATIYVSASFFGIVFGGSGTTTDVSVLHNGVSLFFGQIDGYGGGGGHATFGSSPNQSYAAAVDVAAGDTLDFCVGYGNGSFSSDSTGVSVTITDAPPGPAKAVINEVQSANSSTISDEDGDHPDWIEIHNAGGQSLDLLNYGLSDDPALPFKWTFPSYSLQPGQYLVVFASDKDRKTGPYFHTNYAIKSLGETISLTAPDGTLVSQLPPRTIPQEMSFGRKPDASDTLFFFSTPTPGRPNNTNGYTGVLLSPPTFSRARGFYPSAFNLILSTSEPGATIRYTTDGSAPTEASPVYTTAIPILAGAAGQIFRTTPVRARLFKTDYMPSPIETCTYMVGPGSSTRYNLPVVCLSTDDANLNDPATGIFANPTLEGDAWERPIHVEFFEPQGTDGFSCDAGVRVHGSYSATYPQKSMRLYSDHQGGPGSFNYQIFPETPVTDYTRFMLRNWGNDNELSVGYTYIRDALCQSLVSDLDIDYQRYRPGIVFINGAYWGLYSVYEREDKYWLNNHHPEIDKDNLDVIQMINVQEVEEGDAVAWTALLDWLQANDTIVPANSDYLRSQVDVNNILIHNCAEIYYGNTDWPYNNVRIWRERTPGSKWRWTLYDIDASFGLVLPYTYDNLAFASARGGGWLNPDRLCMLLASLLRNPTSEYEFINRMADMLNTVFRPDVVAAKVDSMTAEIAPYMPEQFARWGNVGNVTQWNTNLQALKNFANHRPAALREQLVTFFKLSGTSNLTLTSPSPGCGSIAVNSISLPGSSLPWQGIYFCDVPIKLTAVPAAGYRFVRWEGGGLGSQNPATLVLSGDTTITAMFEVSQ